MPSALRQLRQTKYYTKLDQRSAYNFIRIWEGDEWKTAFSTTRGHYEYTVMPFNLANCPSVFQSFMNDVFRDMLDRRVIMYIDDILIYSNTLNKCVEYVRLVLQRLIKLCLSREVWISFKLKSLFWVTSSMLWKQYWNGHSRIR